jgi:hypothetical protein
MTTSGSDVYDEQFSEIISKLEFERESASLTSSSVTIAYQNFTQKCIVDEDAVVMKYLAGPVDLSEFFRSFELADLSAKIESNEKREIAVYQPKLLGLCKQLLSRCQEPRITMIHDTHASPACYRDPIVCPDISLSIGQTPPSHMISLCHIELKTSLLSLELRKDAICQISQLAQASFKHQPRRLTYYGVITDLVYAQLIKYERKKRDIGVTTTRQRLMFDENGKASLGCIMLQRLLLSTPTQLGWVEPSITLPPSLVVYERIVEQVYSPVHKQN